MIALGFIVIILLLCIGVYGMVTDRLILVGFGFVAGTAALIGLVLYESNQWEHYREAHDCVQQQDTRIIPIITCTQVGKATICTPLMTTQHRWICDPDTPDAEEIWR